VFKAGDLIVDVNHKVVQVAHAVHLTVMEYALLELLVFNAGRLLTQHRLAHEIWVRRAATRHCKCYGQRSVRSARNWTSKRGRQATSRPNLA
jgi:DNA-binding winged helix-turn-helix (wHTH) protein